MKKVSLILFLASITLLSYGQEVVSNEQICLDDIKEINDPAGKFKVLKYVNDTTYLNFRSYGPCNAKIRISVKNLTENNAVDLVVENLSEEEPIKNCFCMYILNPIIIGVDSPQSKAWVLRNTTAPREEYEKWYWGKM